MLFICLSSGTCSKKNGYTSYLKLNKSVQFQYSSFYKMIYNFMSDVCSIVFAPNLVI